MSRLRAFAMGACVGILGLAFLPAQADQWNKKTILTVNESVALPNAVLQPGKYVMKLMDSQSNRHIVQVFDENEQKLITTILAIPNYRLTPAEETQFGFWESTAGQPRALKAWFYPGDNFGQEFAYPKDMAALIARANNANVPAIMTDSEDVAKAEVQTMTPSGETQELSTEQQQVQAQTETRRETETTTTAPSTEQREATAQTQPETMTQPQTSTTSQPETSATAQAETQTETTPSAVGETQVAPSDIGQRSELPRTASPLPLMGLAGLASAAAAAAIRAKRNS